MAFETPVAYINVDVSTIRETMETVLIGKQRYVMFMLYKYLLARQYTWENGITVKNFMGMETKQRDTQFKSFNEDMRKINESPVWKRSEYYRLWSDYQTSPNLYKPHNDLLQIIKDDALPTDNLNMDVRIYMDICTFHKFGAMTRADFEEYVNTSVKK